MIGDYSCMYTYPLKAGSNEGNIYMENLILCSSFPIII